MMNPTQAARMDALESLFPGGTRVRNRIPEANLDEVGQVLGYLCHEDGRTVSLILWKENEGRWLADPEKCQPEG